MAAAFAPSDDLAMTVESEGLTKSQLGYSTLLPDVRCTVPAVRTKPRAPPSDDFPVRTERQSIQ